MNDIFDKRKAFNFFRSYWEVGKELSNKDRLALYDAILTYQFTGEVTPLTGIANIIFISQRHSLDSQIKGYITKNKGLINKINQEPTQDPTVGGTQDPTQQVEEQVQVEVKEEEEEEVQQVNKKKSKPKINYIYFGEFKNIQIEDSNIDEFSILFEKEKIEWIVKKLDAWLETKTKKSIGLRSFKAYCNNWVEGSYIEFKNKQKPQKQTSLGAIAEIANEDWSDFKLTRENRDLWNK